MRAGWRGSVSSFLRSRLTTVSTVRSVTYASPFQTVWSRRAAAEDDAAAGDQLVEQVELLPGEFGFDAVHQDLTSLEVHRDALVPVAARWTRRVRRSRSTVLVPSHDRADARLEFADAEGLREVIVGAAVETDDDVGFGVAGRQHQDQECWCWGRRSGRPGRARCRRARAASRPARSGRTSRLRATSRASRPSPRSSTAKPASPRWSCSSSRIDASSSTTSTRRLSACIIRVGVWYRDGARPVPPPVPVASSRSGAGPGTAVAC